MLKNTVVIVALVFSPLVCIHSAVAETNSVSVTPLAESLPVDQSNTAESAATKQLKQKLATLSGFSAHFSQQVLDSKKQLVQQAGGRVELVQPDKFRWETAEPNENILQSDGETVWYYDPFVEQVTTYWLKDTIHSNPILLLLQPNSDAWQRYDIEQISTTQFSIKAKENDGQIAQLNLLITKENQLDTLTILDNQGQTSIYKFSQFKFVDANDFTEDYFKFNLPLGVELDDQRR